MLRDFPYKAGITFILTSLWAVFEETLSIAQDLLFSVDPELAVGAGLLILLDTVVAVGFVIRDEGMSGIKSYRLQTMGWKVFGYFAVIATCATIATSTADVPLAGDFFAPWDDGALIYVMTTEGWSVFETVKSDPKSLLKRILTPTKWLEDKVEDDSE